MTKNRIRYIDAMRGFAMTLVVIGHIMLFSFNTTDNVIQEILCSELELPLFFMVSGFLIRFPKSGFWSVFKGKTFALCIPASIFIIIRAWINGASLLEILFDHYKYGYWFTYSLFAFITLYFIYKAVAKSLKLSKMTQTLFLFVFAFVVLYISVWCLKNENNFLFIPLLGLGHFRYFLYFIIGTVLANYNMLAKNTYKPREEVLYGLILAVCLLLHIYRYKDANLSYIGSTTFWISITEVSGLLVLFLGFKKYVSWSESQMGGVIFQKIGRYTLDVNFIHYFFLPRNLNMVGEWFQAHPNPLIEFVFALLIAIPVISASLLVGRIIRLNPTLAHWLLGAK